MAEIKLTAGTKINFSDFYNEIIRTAENDEIITEILFLDFSKIQIIKLCEDTFTLPEGYKNNSKYKPLLSRGKKTDIATLQEKEFRLILIWIFLKKKKGN